MAGARGGAGRLGRGRQSRRSRSVSAVIMRVCRARRYQSPARAACQTFNCSPTRGPWQVSADFKSRGPRAARHGAAWGGMGRGPCCRAASRHNQRARPTRCEARIISDCAAAPARGPRPDAMKFCSSRVVWCTAPAPAPLINASHGRNLYRKRVNWLPFEIYGPRGSVLFCRT